MDTIVALISVFFGWLLGISHTILVDYIRSNKQRKIFKSTLCLELTELQYKLALIVYQLSVRLGRLDRELIDWLHPKILSYNGPDKNDRLIESFKRVSKTDDSVLQAYSQQQNLEGKGMSLKKYNMVFLTTQINTLSLLDANLQSSIFCIHERLNILNQDVEKYWFYFEKSFDSSLDETNHQIVADNINGCFEVIIGQGRILVDKISYTIGQLK